MDDQVHFLLCRVSALHRDLMRRRFPALGHSQIDAVGMNCRAARTINNDIIWNAPAVQNIENTLVDWQMGKKTQMTSYDM